MTSEALDTVASRWRGPGSAPSVYAGFDPTAPSLHLGNLVVLVAMKHFQAAGFRPVLLVCARSTVNGAARQLVRPGGGSSVAGTATATASTRHHLYVCVLESRVCTWGLHGVCGA